jgi:hypothetical protein
VDRTSLIRALAFVLGVALLLAVGWGAFKAVSEAHTINQNQSKNDNTTTLDSDSSLALVIDSLESNWKRRVNYNFSVSQDPLNLSRTIVGYSYNRAGYREIEEDTEFRLSATVVDDHPKAIIKYQGKSHVVKIGDMIGEGYYVQRIGAKSAVLAKGGQTIFLQNKALPDVMGGSESINDNTQEPTSEGEQY